MSRLPARIAAVVLVASMAACAPAVDPPPSGTAPSPSMAAPPPPQPQPAAQAETTAETTAETAAQTAAVTPPPAEAAPGTKAPDTPAWAPPVPGPKHLLGLDGDRVSQLLGPPDFRREDNPAEIWQYRSAACVLDLFLYGQGGGGWRVTHVEMRDLGKPAVSEADCLRALFKDRPRSTG